jgi:hypothetical protein
VKFSCRRKVPAMKEVTVKIASWPSYILVVDASNISLSTGSMFNNIMAYSTAIPVGLSAQDIYF